MRIEILESRLAPAVVANNDLFTVNQGAVLTVSAGTTPIAESGFNDAAGINANATADSPFKLGDTIHNRGQGEPSWVDLWRVSDGGSDAGHHLGKAETSPTFEGDGAFHGRVSQLIGETWIHRGLSQPQFGRFILEQWIQLPANGILASRPNGPGGFGPSWRAAGGKFWAGDGDGQNNTNFEDTGFTVQPLKWHLVTLIVDVPTQSYQFFVDGQRYNAPDPLNFRNQPTSITRADYLFDTDIWLDSIRYLPLAATPTQGLLANDTGSGPLYSVLVDGPAHGQLQFHQDGSFVYTPGAGFVGTDTFTYRASNGTEDSNLATVTITVPTFAENDAFTVPASRGGLAATLTPGNILVTNHNHLFEYTPSGALVQMINQIGDSRDLVMDAQGRVHFFQGTFDPFLTTFDPQTLLFQQTTFAGWSTADTLNSGGIAVFGDYVFVTDMGTASPGGPNGVVRFNLANGTAVRFDSGQETYDLNIGLDGLLYVLSGGIRVYNPTTLQLIRSFTPAIGLNALAVDAAGHIFATDKPGGGAGEKVYHLDSNGAILGTLPGTFGGLVDVDLNADGRIIVASHGGDVLLTDVSLQTSSWINTFPSTTSFAAWVPGTAPSVLTNDTLPTGVTAVAQLVAGPGHGRLFLNSDGRFTYLPDPGYVGADSFTYQVLSDSMTSNVATVVLTVPRPTADDAYVTDRGVPLTVGAGTGVLANDQTWITGGPTAAVTTPPVHGTLDLQPDGSFVYTPQAGFVGIDMFSYQGIYPLGPIAESGFNDASGLNSNPTANSPFTLGSNPNGQGLGEPGWAGGWSASGATVLNSGVWEGDGAVQMVGTAGVSRKLILAQTGTFRFDVTVRALAGGGLQGRLLDTTQDGSVASVGPTWLVNQNGTIEVMDGPDNWEDTGIPWGDASTWHKLSVIVDFQAGTWELHVDDVKFQAPDPLNFRGSPHVLDQVNFFTEGPGAVVDAVRITPVPATLLSPATVTLTVNPGIDPPTITSPASPQVVNAPSMLITGTAEAGSRVRIYADLDGNGQINGAETWIAEQQLGAGATGFAITTPLTQDAVNRFLATATNGDGLESQPRVVPTITEDSTPPTVSAPDLEATSDTGTFSTDDLTKDNTPTFSGTAEAGVTVELWEGATLRGTTTAVGGTWSITTAVLGDGAHTVFARARDAAGNSTDSASLTVTIDTQAPTVSQPDLSAVSDTGAFDDDNVTANPTPTFTGMADSGSTVVLFAAGTPVGTGVAADGTYAITASTLADGTRGITAQATDVAGNVSSLTSPLSVVIDTVRPTVTIDQALDQLDPTGEETVRFTVVFSEVVQDFTAADVIVSGTAGATTVLVSGSGPTYTIAVSDMARPGTVQATIAADVAVDSAGNLNSGSSSSDNTVTAGILLATGADAGAIARVRLFDARTGVQFLQFVAYNVPRFKGGVRVALADVTGDRIPDLITASGTGLAGGALVKIYDGADLLDNRQTEIFSFQPYGLEYTRQLHVAAADFDGDNHADIVIGGMAKKGPYVTVFDGQSATNQTALAEVHFQPFGPRYQGGVVVAAGDVTGSPAPDLIVSQSLNGSRVRVYSGPNLATLETDFRAAGARVPAGGVFVGAGDLDHDGRADIMVGFGAGSRSLVKVFKDASADLLNLSASLIASRPPVYKPTFLGGVRVAAADLDGDQVAEVFTAPGRGPERRVRVLKGLPLGVLDQFFAETAPYAAGLFIAAARLG